MGTKDKPLALSDPITGVPGVGAKRAADLDKLGIRVAGDLLTLWPRRHVDRTVLTPLWQLTSGQTFTVVGVIRATSYEPRGGRSFLRVTVTDGSFSLSCLFFHAHWLRRQLREGMRLVLTGRVEQRGAMMTMVHPEFEVLSGQEEPERGLVPIYPLAGDLKQRFMQRLMEDVVPRLASQVLDPLPTAVIAQEHLPIRSWAIINEHRPPSNDVLEAARRRLVFDEFFRLSLAVLSLHSRGNRGISQHPNGPLAKKFLDSLPFQLTSGQQEAWQAIADDLEKSSPMARLLQGDVGSGKTVVAALTLLSAIDGGRQAAFMAPTELLAEQHYLGLEALLSPLGIRLKLLTGRDSQAEYIRQLLAQGEVDLVVGTQALLSESVAFANLGVIVIDEQHRFGVRQRAHLSEKGFFPDMLVMTATPIPRTLALTLYGDLEVSQITELPPGRLPIKTVHVSNQERRIAYGHILEEIKGGRQAYVVCPLVTPSEEIDAKSAIETYEGMKQVPGWSLELLHGRLSSQEKTEAMERFRSGEADVLVATSIVEVGVDVPNATVMVIEGAERFGLAQLHQLRGRIGRGPHASTCYLVSDPVTEEAEERIAAMVRTQNGLELAEDDLRIRGPGEVLGMRQHGATGFELANPIADLALMERAREVAREILAQDPYMALPEHRALRGWVQDAIDQAIPSHVLH